jgi:hypothetical protein
MNGGMNGWMSYLKRALALGVSKSLAAEKTGAR